MSKFNNKFINMYFIYRGMKFPPKLMNTICAMRDRSANIALQAKALIATLNQDIKPDWLVGYVQSSHYPLVVGKWNSRFIDPREK